VPLDEERALSDPFDVADAALADRLAAPLPGEDAGELVTLEVLAERSELSLPLLEAIVREGLLLPRVEGDEPLFAVDDADTVRAGLALVEAGLPLAELLDLARHADEALRGVADQAVEAFLTYVRDAVHGTASSPDDATTRLLGAFETMLPATERLVGLHFRRLVVERARERVGELGAGG
jgi:hypothetical protein